MKKTLVLYMYQQDFGTWSADNNIRTYQRDRLTRVKANGVVYVIVYLNYVRSSTLDRLSRENIVEVLWLGNARQNMNSGLLHDIQAIVQCRFEPKKQLPERDMGMKGLASFHSLPVYVRLHGEEAIQARKAWYMFHTKTWVFAGTVETIDVAEWFAPWFELEAQ